MGNLLPCLEGPFITQLKCSVGFSEEFSNFINTVWAKESRSEDPWFLLVAYRKQLLCDNRARSLPLIPSGESEGSFEHPLSQTGNTKNQTKDLFSKMSSQFWRLGGKWIDRITCLSQVSKLPLRVVRSCAHLHKQVVESRLAGPQSPYTQTPSTRLCPWESQMLHN